MQEPGIMQAWILVENKPQLSKYIWFISLLFDFIKWTWVQAMSWQICGGLVVPYTFTFICSLSVILYWRIIVIADKWVRLNVVEIHFFGYLFVMQFLIQEFFQTE